MSPFLFMLRKGFSTQNLGIFDIPGNKIAFWKPSQRGFGDSKTGKNDIIAIKRGQKEGIFANFSLTLALIPLYAKNKAHLRLC